MADTIKISLELADAAALKTLQDLIKNGDLATKNLKILGKQGKSTFDEISVGIGKTLGVYDIFAGNVAANVVTGAFNAMVGAAGSLFNLFITDGVTAAQASEDALNSLNVALAQSGLLTDGASDRFTAFAKTIQQTTAFEDDLVIKNIALLASLTSLDEDGLKGATTAATNLSAALGKDLGTTTEALAKAANGNTATIKKMGIQFEESGTKAGTFQNILAAIEDKVGGTATSKINTYSGALAQNRNAFSDLQEEIGGLITQNPAVVSAINAVTSVLTGSSGSVKDGSQAYKELVAEGLILFIDTATLATIAVNTLLNAFNIAFNGIKVTVLGSLAGVAGALSFFSDSAETAFETLKSGASDAIKEINDSNGKGPLVEMATNLAKIGLAAEDGLGKLKSGAESVKSGLDNSTDSVNKLTEAQKLANEENNKFAEGLAKQADDTKAAYELRLAEISAFYDSSATIEQEKGNINFEALLAREIEFAEAKATLLLQNLEEENARIEASTVDPSIKLKAKLAAEQKYQTDSLKLSSEFTNKSVALGKQEIKQKEDDQRNSLNLFASLASSKNKTLGAIGKTAALVQVAIDTEQAASSAFKFGASVGGPPLGFVFQGIAYAAQAAKAANIAGIQFNQGGIVPGTSMTGDRIQARVNSGEMVLNRNQQQELFELANGRGNQTSGITREEVAVMVAEVANRPVVINIDGREVFNVIRDGQNSGRRF